MSKTMSSIMAELELEQRPPSKIVPVGRISVWRILRQAAQSSVRFVELIASGSMLILPNRLGEFYRIDGEGTYRIFREAISHDGEKDPLTVLVVGFRLRLIGSNRLLHWAFQRICILTTPIWSGFPGYRVKLWMVDPKTMNYLGIYQWAGEKNATSYVDWLASLLLPLSTKSSVWYELHPHKRLDESLFRHKARSDPTLESPTPLIVRWTPGLKTSSLQDRIVWLDVLIGTMFISLAALILQLFSKPRRGSSSSHQQLHENVGVTKYCLTPIVE